MKHKIYFVAVCLIALAMWVNYGCKKDNTESLVGSESQEGSDADDDVIITSGYVDLGLPSGMLWKAVNEPGFYTYDEALQMFRDSSCMQLNNQRWFELRDECEWTWLGNGYKIKGPNDKCIFLPAEGYRDCNGVINYEGVIGEYWTTGFSIDDFTEAWEFRFNSQTTGSLNIERCNGLSVRLTKN